MKIWAAVVREHGMGCDYSIGCGEKMIPLISTNFDEAVYEIKETLEQEYGMFPGSEDRNPRSIAIVTIEGLVDLDVWANERAADADAEDDERDERYREYLALKAEFE